MADLELTLSWLDMSQYLERFLQAGFDSWETVLEVTEADLDVLEVELGHRRKLQREIANTRRLAQDPAFVAPLYPSLYGPETSQFDGVDSIKSSGYDAPAAGQGKRSYRHHPKPDPNAPERPYSAYVNFSNSMRENPKLQSLTFTDISRLVGESWQALAPEDKERWKQDAAAPWEEYKMQLAAYQQSENHKQYLRYLEKFKRDQAAKRSDILQLKHESSQSSSPITSSPAKIRRMTPSQFPEIKAESSKVPINRAKREVTVSGMSSGGSLASHGQRISHACESCRQKKSRCPGERPVCQNCKNLRVSCVYADGKRDLEKKLIANLWEKVAAYEALLLRFIGQVDDEDQSAIQKSLLMPPQLDVIEPKGLSQSPASDHGDEDTVSGVGSMGSTDNTNEEDFARFGTAKETHAFIGQASEEKWLQRLEQQLSDSMLQDGENNPTSRGGVSVKSVPRKPSKTDSPYPEDMDASIVGNQIDPYGLPVKKTADALLNAYFTTVHPSFPIVNEAHFYRQFEDYFITVDLESFKDRAFVAILQIVFAIGAVHAHRVRADWAGDDRDHLLYLARARVLSMEIGILNEFVYHGQVQLFGLAGMYFLATNQINRAWTTLGLAIRCAQALGMHLQNTTSGMTELDKDFRVRIWHSVVSLERTLTVVTGRPSMVSDQDCSVPLPQLKLKGSALPQVARFNTSERTSSMDFAHVPDSTSSGPALEADHRPTLSANISNTTAYFQYYVDLNAFAQSVIAGLYSPEIKHLKWTTIQKRILKLDQKLLQWVSKLPKEFDVHTPLVNTPQNQLQVALRILVNSTRTIINRPCLCRLERRIPNQSKSSLEINRDSVKKCVDAARAIIVLLPDRPDTQSCHSGPIWWMLHHHLRRAGTVLLLELALHGRHMPSESEQVLASAKKAVNWLHVMATNSAPAKQSWITLSRLLELAVHRMGGDMADIVDPYQPHSTAAADLSLSTTGWYSPTYGTAALDAWQPEDDYSRGLHGQTQLFEDLDSKAFGRFGNFQDTELSNSFFPASGGVDGMAAEEGGEDQVMSYEDDTAQWINFQGGQ